MKGYKRKIRSGALLLCLLACLSWTPALAAGGSVTLPSSLTLIEEEAFAGTAIRRVCIPDTVRAIESMAFADTGLERVYFPEGPISIAPDAFQNCPDLVAVVYPGSEAAAWCGEHGVRTLTYTSLGVASHTQAEIRSFVDAHPAETSSRTTYRREPTEDPYAPGLISQESTQNAINMLNQVRYIAGLDANVANDAGKEEMMAAAAMLNGLNGSLSHYPMRPEVLEDIRYDDLYNLGYQGASSSNLYMGPTNLAWSVLGYLYDSDSSNINRVGHRRWVLNPTMGKTAFGYYDKGPYSTAFSGMYAFDRSAGGGQAPVAWPAQQTPLSHFIRANSQAWSVSFGYRLNADAIHVTLIRDRDGATWNFSTAQADGAFYVNNDGYGQPGCVIFRAASLSDISAGDIFQVILEDSDKGKILRYTVEFFEL